MGKRVTSNNLSGDGWKYEPGTNMLVLNGFGVATLGYNVEKNPSGYGDGKTWRYANIYAKGIDLTIRTEGKVSYIGDMNFGSNFYEVKSDDTHAVYSGIYNSGGKITITGSVKLCIGSNNRAIYAGSVNIEGDGVVDAKINNWHDTSKYYVNSVVYGSSIGKGKVNFNGSGIIRLKMWLKKPDGSSKIQQISPDLVSFAENVLHQRNTISDCHEEITAYTCDGIFLSTKGVFQYWSYSEKICIRRITVGITVSVT